MTLKNIGRRLDERGQGAVEFALVLPALVLLLMGIFEFTRHYHARLTVRHAVSEAARFGSTGQLLIDPESGETMSRAASIIAAMQRSAGGLDLDVEQIILDPADGGGPNDVVRMVATYRFTFMDSPLVRSFAPPFAEFTVATTFKNEPVF